MFSDRADAGRQLGAALRRVTGPDVVVVGLPRGGVPVAYEVAVALGAPLDVICVRKVGVPGQAELAMGAVGEGGVQVVDAGVVRAAGVSEEEFAEAENAELVELARRARLYRQGREAVPLAGRTIVVVDDGIATGSTARAACRVVRARGASRVVLAVPVAPPDAVSSMGADADEVVCLLTPEAFWAVGQFYADFRATTDEEVADLLHALPTSPNAII
jgi:putative phosphoribosyl transferase